MRIDKEFVNDCNKEVYVFTFELCNDKIDDEGDKFSLKALYDIATGCIGKTATIGNIGNNSIKATIFKAKVIFDNSSYCYVEAKAYITGSDLGISYIINSISDMEEIVSIECTIGSKVCSICGLSNCNHIVGKSYSDKELEYIEYTIGDIDTLPIKNIVKLMYKGNSCFHIIDNVKEFYSWTIDFKEKK